MRKYLLPKTVSFYKANPHCLTVRSDGNQTPEEVREACQNWDILLQHTPTMRC